MRGFRRALCSAKYCTRYMTMGIINDKPNQTVNAESREVQKSDKPLKPCCACPETKKARDDWYANIFKYSRK